MFTIVSSGLGNSQPRNMRRIETIVNNDLDRVCKADFIKGYTLVERVQDKILTSKLH